MVALRTGSVWGVIHRESVAGRMTRQSTREPEELYPCCRLCFATTSLSVR